MGIGQQFGQAAQLAENLVAAFHAIYPPAMVQLTTPRAHGLREKAFRQLLDEIAHAQTTHRLGIFRRIVFARAFQRSLRARGYSKEFNREITAKMLIRLSMAGRPGTGRQA